MSHAAHGWRLPEVSDMDAIRFRSSVSVLASFGPSNLSATADLRRAAISDFEPTTAVLRLRDSERPSSSAFIRAHLRIDPVLDSLPRNRLACPSSLRRAACPEFTGHGGRRVASSLETGPSFHASVPSCRSLPAVAGAFVPCLAVFRMFRLIHPVSLFSLNVQPAGPVDRDGLSIPATRHPPTPYPIPAALPSGPMALPSGHVRSIRRRGQRGMRRGLAGGPARRAGR